MALVSEGLESQSGVEMFCRQLSAVHGQGDALQAGLAPREMNQLLEQRVCDLFAARVFFNVNAPTGSPCVSSSTRGDAQNRRSRLILQLRKRPAGSCPAESSHAAAPRRPGWCSPGALRLTGRMPGVLSGGPPAAASRRLPRHSLSEREFPSVSENVFHTS